MKSSHLFLMCLMLMGSTALAQSRPKTYQPKTPPPTLASPAQPKAPDRASPEFINGIADTGQFLPDTTELARIGSRFVRVKDYVSAYFAQYPEYRPRPDSLGRIEFLNSMINKDLLGQAALASGRETGFEDRLTMRAHTQRVLSNAVYQRLVNDSVTVTEGEIQAAYETQKYDQHFRHILFNDRKKALEARAALLARKITWDAAVAKYHIGKGKSDLGWVPQQAMPPELAVEVYPLAVGAISEPVADHAWWHLFQSVERRQRTAVPEYHAIRTMLRMNLLGLRTAQRAERIQAVLRERIHMSYDSTAVVWVSSHFGASNVAMESGPMGSPSVTVSDTVPAFSPEDTSRVLARWDGGGRLTLSAVLRAYTDISPISRPPMNTPEAVQAQIDALVLEPYMAQYAIERGLDKDPGIVAQIENKREELLVQHLFADSIESKVWVSKADRQQYYKAHPADFTTYANVTFAVFAVSPKSAADSLAMRLRAGEKARDILLADSLAGVHRGSIQVRTEQEHGSYHKLLFEEMRPGQVSVEGPDTHGDYAVLQSLAFDPGHLLAYEEVEGMVDESMQNIRAESMLKELLARLRHRFPVSSRPEILQRVRLVDPTLDRE